MEHDDPNLALFCESPGSGGNRETCREQGRRIFDRYQHIEARRPAEGTGKPADEARQTVPGKARGPWVYHSEEDWEGGGDFSDGVGEVRGVREWDGGVKNTHILQKPIWLNF